MMMQAAVNLRGLNESEDSLRRLQGRHNLGLVREARLPRNLGLLTDGHPLNLTSG